MKKYKRGFTFVELLAVMSVLIVLAGLFIPRYIELQRQSGKIVCNTNIDTLSTCYRAAEALNPDSPPEEVLSKALEENSDIACPLGYRFITGASENGLFVICPEHGNRTLDGADLIVKTISNDMNERTSCLLSDISSMSIGEKRQYFENHGFDASGEYMFGKDFLSSYLFNAQYNGSWPIISDDYAKEHKIPKGLTIRPLIVNTGKPENTLIYAAKDDEAAEMLYIDGTWYKRDGAEEISLAQSYEAIVRNAAALWKPIL